MKIKSIGQVDLKALEDNSQSNWPGLCFAVVFFELAIHGCKTQTIDLTISCFTKTNDDCMNYILLLSFLICCHILKVALR